RMILMTLGGRCSSSTVTTLDQYLGNTFVTTFLSHATQAHPVVSVPLGVGSRLEQHLDDLRVSLTDRKMNRRRVEVASTTSFWIFGKQAAHGTHVTGGGSRDHVPRDVIDLRRFNHETEA